MTYGIARIAQVLGEGEKRRGMMNVFLDTARDRGTIKVMGRSVLKKQYIYVKDLVEVLTILALGNENYSADSNIIVNIGMPEAYSNLEVAQIVNDVYGNPTPIDYDDSYPEKGRPFHMDISRLRNEIGYEPLNMKEAIGDFRDNREQV
jgi:UDP-glucose 4-epimerase